MDPEKEEKRQCNFFVKKRKRFCRLLPAKGKKFCGEHINLEKDDNGKSDHPGTGRIPCPFDSHHTVAVKQLEKHLKVCNSRPKEQPIYYQKGINAGLTEYEKDLETLRLATFSLEEIQQIISKVDSAYTDHIGSIDTEILHHDALKTELDNPENGASARKHLLQLDSLLGHMNSLELLQPNTCFVEFGAGRGRLSQWIQQAMCNLEQTSFLLIDRAAVRHKKDAFYQRDDGGPRYERISMDIENLILGSVPTVCHHVGRPVVAYTKHLCGAATDLALRCLLETRNERQKCHHICSSDAQSNLSKVGDLENLQNPETSTVETTSSNSSSCSGTSPSSRNADCNPVSANGHSGAQSNPRQDASESHLSNREGNSNVHQQGTETCGTLQNVERPLVSTNPVKGVVMALCCHHRCLWRTHVGKQFFKDAGISEREFMALVRMSSWATCGTRPAKKEDKDDSKEGQVVEKNKKDKIEIKGDDRMGGQKVKGQTDEQEEDQMKELATPKCSENKENRSKQGKEKTVGGNSGIPEEQESIVSSLGLSVSQREEIGFKCKRILDMGRLVYLKNLGMDAKLVYYVERSISPENAVLIATPMNLAKDNSL